MKTKWIAAALLSSALAVGCGDRGAENTENQQGNEGTSVAVAPDAGDQAALDQPGAPAAEVSPNAAAPAPRPTATRPPARPVQPAPRVEAAPRPADRVQAEAPRATTPARPTVRLVTIPAGTALPLELTSAVSSETARVEQPVSARLRSAVRVDGDTVFPAGAIVNGEVAEVERPGRVQGRARLALRFTSITVDGRREDIRTNPVTFQGEQTKGEDATKIGVGAGVGAAIGGLLGGGDGAAKGAAIGGAAGTGAVLATRGRDVELAAGSDVNATLASAVDVEVR